MKEFIEVYSIAAEPQILSRTEVTSLNDEVKAETLALLQSGSTVKSDETGKLVLDTKTPIIKVPTRTIHHICHHDEGNKPCEDTEID